jgi:hypothetical protein
VPVREIGMVTYRHSVKERLLQLLKEHVLAGVAGHLRQVRLPKVLPVGP